MNMIIDLIKRHPTISDDCKRLIIKEIEFYTDLSKKKTKIIEDYERICVKTFVVLMVLSILLAGSIVAIIALTV